MGLQKTKVLFKFLIVLAILISFSAHFGASMRTLHGDNHPLLKNYVPNWESLAKAPPGTPQPSSGGSPCSNVPGPGHCDIKGMNFAGRLPRSPPPPSPSVGKAAIDNIAAAFMKI